MVVDPRDTSRRCSRCRHVERGNRRSQAEFRCRACGFRLDADLNTALNIRWRADVRARRRAVLSPETRTSPQPGTCANYHACYLALGQLMGVEVYTSDKKFYGKASKSDILKII